MLTTIVTIRLTADKNTDMFGTIMTVDPQNSLLPPISLTTGLSETADDALAVAGERLAALIRQHGTIEALYEARTEGWVKEKGVKTDNHIVPPYQVDRSRIPEPMDISSLENKLRNHVVTDAEKMDMQKKGFAAKKRLLTNPFNQDGEKVTVFTPDHSVINFPQELIFVDEDSCWKHMYFDYAIKYYVDDHATD